MNYRHAFHAGNFADVFKHMLVLQLLRALQRKGKGFLYLDTHAGRGAYDLATTTAPQRRNREPEWPDGIGRIWAAASLPAPLDDYRTQVREFNRRHGAGGERLRFYPGSPCLAELVRRAQDRLVFWERERTEAGALRREFAGRSRVQVVCGDGYDAPRAALPPLERRALILIDPPYEEPAELESVRQALREGLARFASGVFAVWYPLTERAGAEVFRAAVRAWAPPAAFWAELDAAARPQVRLKGCGMLIINPPWRVPEELPPLLTSLAGLLGFDARTAARTGWLVPRP